MKTIDWKAKPPSYLNITTLNRNAAAVKCVARVQHKPGGAGDQFVVDRRVIRRHQNRVISAQRIGRHYRLYEAACFQTNVFGAIYGFEAVIPRMLGRGHGQIVGVASLAGFRGLPGSAA